MDDAAVDGSAATRMIPGLGQPSLHQRVHAANAISARLVSVLQHFRESNDDDKATVLQPYRRLGRALVHAWVSRHHREGHFAAALLAALRTALDATELDMAAFVVEQAADLKTLWTGSPVRAAAVVELCVFVASSSSSSSAQGEEAVPVPPPPTWAPAWAALVGECLDVVASDSESHVWRRSAAKVGECLAGRRCPLPVSDVAHGWADAGRFGALAALHLYLVPAVGPQHRAYSATLAFKAVALVAVDKHVLSSKQAASAGVLRQVGRVVASLSAADWKAAAESAAGSDSGNGSWEAVVLARWKKSPEGLAGAVSAIVTHFRPAAVDLSAFVTDGAAAAVLRALKSPNVSVRESGQAIAAALARRCDVAALDAMARGALCDAAGAKTGPSALVQPYQRLAVFTALADCAPLAEQQASMDHAALAGLSAAVVATVLGALDRETDENNALVAAAAAGQWLRCLCCTTSSDVAAVLPALKAGVASKTKGAAYGLALVTAAAAGAQPAGDAGASRVLTVLVPPLAAALASVAKDAQKKPQLAQPEAALALRLLVQAAAAGVADATAALDANKLWPLLVTSAAAPSFLYSRALLNQAGLVYPSHPPAATTTSTSSTAAAPSTPLLALALAESAAVVVATAAVHFPAHLGKSFAPVSDATPAGPGPVGNLLAALLHGDARVRRAAAAVVGDLLRHGGLDTCNALLTTLYGWVQAWSEALATYDRPTTTATTTSTATPSGQADDADFAGASLYRGGLAASKRALGVPPAARLSEAVALLARFPVLAAEQVPRGALCDAHPALATTLVLLTSAPLVVESRARAVHLWGSLALGAALFGHGTAAPTLAEALALAVVDAATAGPAAAGRFRRAGAHTAALLLATAGGPAGRAVVVTHLKPLLLGRLAGGSDGSAASVLDVSDEDADKFLNPQAALDAATASAAVNEADIVITNADRAGKKGKFGGDFVEDDDWAERVRKEKAAKLIAAKTAAAGDAATAVRKELDEVKARVQAVAERATWALEALRAMCVFAPAGRGGGAAERPGDRELRAVVRHLATDTVPALLPLLRCKLVAAAAFDCVLGLTRALDADLLAVAAAAGGGNLPRDLADALRVVATAIDRPLRKKETALALHREAAPLAGPLQRVLRAVGTYVGRLASQTQAHGPSGGKRQLPPLLPSTVSLLYPVLRGVLTLPAVLPGCELAMMVLDALWPRPAAFHDDAGASAAELEEGYSVRALEGPGARASAVLLPLQASVTATVLAALARLHVEPSPDAVLLRVVTQYPKLPVGMCMVTAAAPAPPTAWLAPLLGEAGLLHPEARVRVACLQALLGLFSEPPPDALVAAVAADRAVGNCLWLLRFDDEEQVRALATRAWEARAPWCGGNGGAGWFTGLSWLEALLPLLAHEGRPPLDAVATAQQDGFGGPLMAPGAHVRLAAARAVAGGMKEAGASAEAVKKLQELYLARRPAPASLASSSSSAAATAAAATALPGNVIGKVITPPAALPSAAASRPVTLGVAGLGLAAPPPKKAATNNVANMLGIGVGAPKPKPKPAGVASGISGIGSGIGGVAAKPKPATPSTAAPSLSSSAAAAAGPPAGNGLAGVASTLTRRADGGGGAVDPPLGVAARLAVAEAFRAAGEHGALQQGGADAEAAGSALDVLDFLLAFGVADSNADVRGAMLAAGRAVVDAYGSAHCAAVIARLEAVLAKGKKAAAAKKGDDEDGGGGGAAGAGRRHRGPEDVASSDARHQGAVVLMGAAGRHLAPDDPTVVAIADSLVAALATPSELVQRAVAECLVGLVQAMKATHATQAQAALEGLVQTLLSAEGYAELRGAAFGLSAFVKGLGIPSLKALDIVPRLKEAAAEGSVSARQGGLMAFECLSERLGLLFEPYVITLIPVLIKSFSHASDLVRDAAQACAKVVMAKLSAHGVKQVLTPILASLPEETQWKSRAEAIRLLGTMAHCAPKQLAACLPQIVPRLVEAGSDPHPKVKEGAKAAMLDISSVIRNPEIARLAPVLLAAMADPATKTKDALEELLQTEFMHSIDAPSLALLVPILGRALRDRGADLKRKSSAITGNMVSMVSDSKALVPYLPQVTPGLQDCLVDPIPDVRASAAKALGSLLGGVGEEEMPETVPWLLRTLASEASPTDRAGAAQGLAEAALALGTQRMDDILDLALALRAHPKSAAREGLLWLLSFMPAALDEAFAPHIGRTLPVILAGLSDPAEAVREVALRSGQVMVSCLGTNHAPLLLPSLVEGLEAEDWRIRHSSLALLGDLLFLVSETRADSAAAAAAGVGAEDNEDEDDDDDLGGGGGVGASARAVATLRQNLGDRAANEVLAALYIVRSDVSITVRQSALQVWKAVVANTPRVLLEIIPVLVDDLIAKLASPIEDLRVVAGRSLGELVRKLGDRVLPKVVPHLRAQLQRVDGGLGPAEDAEAMRQGVCLGLTEILSAATKQQVEAYIGTLVQALQTALCDRSEDVRALAARGFSQLHKTVGPRAVDDVLPTLLLRLDVDVKGAHKGGAAAVAGASTEVGVLTAEDRELALLGLQGLAVTRPRDILEYCVDPSVNASGGHHHGHGHSNQQGKLLAHPMGAPAARALAGVLAVTGTYLGAFFGTLVPALCLELLTAADAVAALEAEAGGAADDDSRLLAERERLETVKEVAVALMAAVTTPGVGFLVSELAKAIEHETDVRRRRWGAFLTEKLFRHSKAAYNDLVPVLLKNLLSRVAETDRPLLQAVNDALQALSTSPVVSLDELSAHLTFVQSCMGSAASDARHRVGAKESLYSATGEFQLPLLTLPKSLEPLLTIALHALMNGSLQQRETAADLIAELATWADPAVLKPSLIKTTGPLIRVVGDRFPSNVKAAILTTLTVLLDRGGAGLKAFVPQLQTTFVKALTDPSRAVRSRAGLALGRLIPLTTRVDPLLSELCAAAAAAEGSAIRASSLDALGTVLTAPGGGDKATAPALEKVQAQACAALLTASADCHAAAAACLAALGALPATDAAAVSDTVITLCDGARRDGAGEAAVCGALLGVAATLQAAGAKAGAVRDDAFDLVASGLKDGARPAVQAAACTAVGTLCSAPAAGPGTAAPGGEEADKARKAESRGTAQAALSAFSSSIAQLAATAEETTRLAALGAVKAAAKGFPGATLQHAARFLPPLAAALKDINIRQKYVAERALRHLLLGVEGDGGKGAALVENAAAMNALSGPEAPYVRDYVRRVVQRQAADSDNEGDKW